MEAKQTVTLRTAVPQDAEALLAIYTPYVRETAITFEWEVPTVQEFAARMAKVLERYPYLVAEQDGVLLGYAYASAFHPRAAYGWSVETSIYVDQSKKRRGTGSQLYAKLEQVLKAQGVLNLDACIAYPAREDEYLTRDSVAFHHKLGYHIVGHFCSCGCKFGRWYDMVWMEKQIGEHLTQPPAIQTFSQVCKSCGL